jgi:NADPH:quinone reductase-like Zn-dependent oxidoreductase
MSADVGFVGEHFFMLSIAISHVSLKDRYYTKEDFIKSGQTYDIIFDTVGKTSFSRCKSSLKQKGMGLWYLALQ